MKNYYNYRVKHKKMGVVMKFFDQESRGGVIAKLGTLAEEFNTLCSDLKSSKNEAELDQRIAAIDAFEDKIASVFPKAKGDPEYLESLFVELKKGTTGPDRTKLVTLEGTLVTAINLPNNVELDSLRAKLKESDAAAAPKPPGQ